MKSITVWRIVTSKYASTAFSGIGAKLHPGRWNLKGDSVVYTAGTESLAKLEMLVHFVKGSKLPKYILIQAKIPTELIETPNQLPLGWNRVNYSSKVPKFGSDWFRSGRSCVLRVPSVHSSSEFNYLINPLHRYFPKIIVGSLQPFRFDPRLVKATG